VSERKQFFCEPRAQQKVNIPQQPPEPEMDNILLLFVSYDDKQIIKKTVFNHTPSIAWLIPRK